MCLMSFNLFVILKKNSLQFAFFKTFVLVKKGEASACFASPLRTPLTDNALACAASDSTDKVLYVQECRAPKRGATTGSNSCVSTSLGANTS